MGTLIYCVEDDTNIRELVLYALKATGFEAVGFSSAADFYQGLSRQVPDLALLDIMLPDEDGITILKKLKNHREWKELSVIMLTAKAAEYDKVLGLDSGADDYITKPFWVMELISRVKAVLRRMPERKKGQMLVIGELRLDEEKHEVFAGESPVSLTCKEFELLAYLMKNKGFVLSRDKILDAIWGYVYEGESRTVDVHIGSLRHKLGAYGEVIKTIRGVGYKMGDAK